MIIAFDYSLTSPCMCISTTGEWVDSSFWFLSDKKKYDDSFLAGKIQGNFHKDWQTPEERYHNISMHFIDIVANNAANVDVVIEGYAMGARGRVFEIGENAGIIKYKLWERDHKLALIPPTVLKRFATGKGNADKLKMNEQFLIDTGVDLSLTFGKPGTNPSSDIIDAFYLARYAFTIKV